MKLDDILHSAGKYKAHRRVGRGTGSGQGKTSGRGTKGFYSRSGAARRLGYEGGQTPIAFRIPKRGFSNAYFKVVYQVVNMCDLEQFEAGARVDAATLFKAGVIGKPQEPLKILGTGTLSKKLTVVANKFSATAAKKIAEAGGAVESV